MNVSNNKKAIIITGSAGGIGQEIVKEMQKLGFFTIGIDIMQESLSDKFLHCDLYELVNSEDRQSRLKKEIQTALGEISLYGLINNAACQILGSITSLSLADFKKSFDINSTAPFLLTQLCFDKLVEGQGTIINISSIHASLTKPEFLAYASSKGALDSLTKALSVSIGDCIKVVGIAPAAIETDMLKAGFDNACEDLDVLKSFHPTQSLGQVQDIAKLCRFLLTEAPLFMNGTIIHIDGGIGNKLHDPA